MHYCYPLTIRFFNLTPILLLFHYHQCIDRPRKSGGNGDTKVRKKDRSSNYDNGGGSSVVNGGGNSRPKSATNKRRDDGGGGGGRGGYEDEYKPVQSRTAEDTYPTARGLVRK